MKDKFSKFSGSLVTRVSMIEAAALDVKDILEFMGTDAPAKSVSDELQQITDLVNVVAEKLGIASQVNTLRDLQEENLAANKKVTENLIKALNIIKSGGTALDKDPDPNLN